MTYMTTKAGERLMPPIKRAKRLSGRVAKAKHERRTIAVNESSATLPGCRIDEFFGPAVQKGVNEYAEGTKADGAVRGARTGGTCE